MKKIIAIITAIILALSASGLSSGTLHFALNTLHHSSLRPMAMRVEETPLVADPKWVRGIREVDVIDASKDKAKQIRFFGENKSTSDAVTTVKKAEYDGKIYWAKLNRHFQLVAIIRQTKIFNYLSKLKLPGIYTPEHFLELEDGIKVMLFKEFPPGETLNEKIGKLSEREAIEIVLRVAYIVKSLHENGIFHWDITPYNIWIADNGEIILFDFDIAFAVKDEILDDPNHDTAKEIYIEHGVYKHGNANYMSSKRYKWRTDILDFLFKNAEKEDFPPIQEELYSLAFTLFVTMLGGDSKKSYEDLPERLKNFLDKAQSNKQCDYDNIDDFIHDLEDCLQPEKSNQLIEQRPDTRYTDGRIRYWLNVRELERVCSKIAGSIDCSEIITGSKSGDLNFDAIIVGSARYFADECGFVPLDLINDIDIHCFGSNEIAGQLKADAEKFKNSFLNMLTAQLSKLNIFPKKNNDVGIDGVFGISGSRTKMKIQIFHPFKGSTSPFELITRENLYNESAMDLGKSPYCFYSFEASKNLDAINIRNMHTPRDWLKNYFYFEYFYGQNKVRYGENRSVFLKAKTQDFFQLLIKIANDDMQELIDEYDRLGYDKRLSLIRSKLSQPIGKTQAEKLELTVYGKKVQVNKQIFDSIQNAAVEDAAAIAKLSEILVRMGYLKPKSKLTKLHIEHYLKFPETVILKVYKAQERVSGYIFAIMPNGNEAYIEHLVVAEPNENKGIGTSLMASALTQIEKRNVAEVQTLARSPQNKEIVKKFKFEHIEGDKYILKATPCIKKPPQLIFTAFDECA
ncbi:MAG: GNAT family N-acetyltransferase [Candidatus Omnitrophota bacterium]